MENTIMSRVLGILSVLIPTVLLLFIANFFLGIVPLSSIQGLPLILPFVLCPIGAVLGLISYRLRKGKLPLIGIVANLVMFVFPIVYNVFALLVFGP